MIKEKLKDCFKKRGIVFIINIVVLCIVFFLILESQKYAHIHMHDFVMPYLDDMNSLESIKSIFFEAGRLPARFISFLLLNWLPEFFEINPNDFIASRGLGGILLSIFILFSCFILTKVFFITEKNEKNLLKRVEFPLIFISISMAFAITLKNKITLYPLFGISEYATYFEYLCPFVFFVCFYLFLFKILVDINVFKNKKIYFSLMLINAFLLGFWSETYIVLILSSLFFLMIVLLISKKNSKNSLPVKNSGTLGVAIT